MSGGRPAADPGFDEAPWGATAVATVGVLASQVLTLLQPHVGTLDVEETPNAALGVLARWLPLAQLPAFLYRPHCGGCLAEGVAAGALFRVLPETLGTWRLVALGFTALLAATGFRWSWRLAGPVAGWTTAAALALPPVALSLLGLTSWGNHFEAGVLAALVLALLAGPPTLGRTLVAGTFAGFAVWWGFAATFAVVAAVLALVVSRAWSRLAAFAAGAVLGSLPWILVVRVLGAAPFEVLRGRDLHEVPQSVATRLHVLFQPATLEALFGTSSDRFHHLPGVVAGLTALLATVVVAAWGDPRARVLPLAVATWGLTWLASPANLDLVTSFSGGAHERVRYAMPLVILTTIAVGVATGLLVRGGRRGAAVVLALGWLGPGALGRLVTWTESPSFSHLSAPAVRGPYIRATLMASLVPSVRSWRCDADPRCAPLRAYRLGVETLQAAAYGADRRPMEALVPPDGVDVGAWLAGVAAAEAHRLRARTSGPGAVSDLAARLRTMPAVAEVDLARVLRDAAGVLVPYEALRLPPQPQGDPAALAAIAWADGLAAGQWSTLPPVVLDAPDGVAGAWFEGDGLGLALLWGPRHPRVVAVAVPEAYRGRFQVGVASSTGGALAP